MRRRPRPTPRRRGTRSGEARAAEDLFIDEDGDARVADERARRLSGAWTLLEGPSDLLVAVKEGRSGLLPDLRDLEPSGAVLAGDLAAFPPSDLLNFLHQGGRTGILLARSDGVERALAVLDGNVAWACSTSPAERLGEVVCRLGFADRARVHELLRGQGEGGRRRRIGQMLVDAGLLGAEDLARSVRHQTVEIFLGLLVSRAGTFTFLRGCARDQLPSQLGLDTEALLLDGLRRVDEMELFRGRVPGAQVRPRRTGKPVHDPLSDEAQLVLGMCEGGLTLAQIAAGSALGEFEATKALYRLLELGYVALDA